MFIILKHNEQMSLYSHPGYRDDNLDFICKKVDNSILFVISILIGYTHRQKLICFV